MRMALLFFQDPGSSLRAIFDSLTRFARFSGLSVNWTKSSVMPIDAGGQSYADPDIPIVWVSKIYLFGYSDIT